MPDWDENSPELEANLSAVARLARDSAQALQTPTLDLVKQWQGRIMKGLDPASGADESWYGRFRGEEGQEWVGVKIGSHEGTPPDLLKAELHQFEHKLRQAIELFDGKLLLRDVNDNVVAVELDDNSLGSILGLMAWVHGEWVRMHPFANGNGRTARLWANWIAMRYGVAPFVRLRPRPGGPSYEAAAYQSMEGNWQAMRPVFESLLEEFLEGV